VLKALAGFAIFAVFPSRRNRPSQSYNPPMAKQILYWVIAIAVVLQLFSCVFMGQSFMPEHPF